MTSCEDTPSNEILQEPRNPLLIEEGRLTAIRSLRQGLRLFHIKCIVFRIEFNEDKTDLLTKINEITYTEFAPYRTRNSYFESEKRVFIYLVFKKYPEIPSCRGLWKWDIQEDILMRISD